MYKKGKGTLISCKKGTLFSKRGHLWGYLTILDKCVGALHPIFPLPGAPPWVKINSSTQVNSIVIFCLVPWNFKSVYYWVPASFLPVKYIWRQLWVLLGIKNHMPLCEIHKIKGKSYPCIFATTVVLPVAFVASSCSGSTDSAYDHHSTRPSCR